MKNSKLRDVIVPNVGIKLSSDTSFLRTSRRKSLNVVIVIAHLLSTRLSSRDATEEGTDRK